MTIPALALIAIGAKNSAVIIATDSAWIHAEMDAINDNPEELGIDLRGSDHGLYLWVGELKTIIFQGEYEVKYTTKVLKEINREDNIIYLLNLQPKNQED